MIKVLLVDDEKLALEYLEHIIDWEYHGFELIGVTTNPEQALAIYKTHRPDLVISDVKMPGLNGLELGDAIREYGGNTHILFLSAYKNFDYVKQAIRLGIDDYILKSDLEEDGFLRKILKLKEEIIKEKAKKQYTITAILEELFRKNISEEVYKDILDENDYIGLHKKYYDRNLLGGLYRENPVKSRNYEAVKSSKKWENVGNSYIIPALLLYRYSYI